MFCCNEFHALSHAPRICQITYTKIQIKSSRSFSGLSCRLWHIVQSQTMLTDIKVPLFRLSLVLEVECGKQRHIKSQAFRFFDGVSWNYFWEWYSLFGGYSIYQVPDGTFSKCFIIWLHWIHSQQKLANKTTWPLSKHGTYVSPAPETRLLVQDMEQATNTFLFRNISMTSSHIFKYVLTFSLKYRAYISSLFVGLSSTLSFLLFSK